VTLRSYIEVLRFEDKLYGEDYYFEAASGIIEIYLHLYDNPGLTMSDDEPDYSKMSAADRKKAKSLARRKKAQEKKDAEQKEKEAEQNGKSSNTNKKGKHGSGAVEDDPNGEELLKKDSLEESQKYVSIISKFAPNRFETWMLQYDVAIRRNKYLLALQALFRAQAIDAERSEYLSRLVDFATKMDYTGDLPGAVGTIIKEETPRLMENQHVGAFLVAASANIRKEGSTASLPTRTAVAKALVEAKSGSVSDAAALIVDGGISARGVSVQTCQDALAALKAFGAGAASAAENWVAQVKERFPLAQGLS
jgi:N-alpha-acetyltransferase 15/16, NatA auxiliary subunit